MQEPTHAPGWRGRPKRYGPINGLDDSPFWLELLERLAPIGCFIVAGLTLLIAGFMFASDLLAGHL